MRHAGSQPAEHVSNCDTHPSDARSPTTLTGFDGDYVLVVHLRLTLTQTARRRGYHTPTDLFAAFARIIGVAFW